MLNIIIMLVVGAALAYISKYNLEPTSVNFGGYVIHDIPLFYVMIASLLAGLVLAYLFHLIDAAAYFFTLKAKKKEIRNGKENILDLTKRIHQLEIENERLKNASSEPSDARAL